MKIILLTLLFLLFASFLGISQTVKPTEDVINHAVLIKYKAGAGSGVLVNKDSAVYLITARHVILKEINKTYNYKDSSIEVTSFESALDSSKITTMNITFAEISNNIKFYTDKDIAVIKLGTVNMTGQILFFNFVKVTNRTGKAINLYDLSKGGFSLFKDTKILFSVIIVGFPTSLGLLNQYDFFTPIIRQGSVAGKNLTKKTIVLDCPVFPGNSGGPVFASVPNASNMSLIGIVTEFIPLADVWQSSQFEELKHVFLENSGYSVVEPMDDILNLIELLNKK